MAEIGLADKGVSPIAVSEPFPLFTEGGHPQNENRGPQRACLDKLQILKQSRQVSTERICS